VSPSCVKLTLGSSGDEENERGSRLYDPRSEVRRLYPQCPGQTMGTPYSLFRTAKSSSLESSSSTALIDTECFRLYFKGLVSEERVRGMKVIVAGAGIAICDPKDNLVLEARKNLEALMEGVTLTIKVAQLEALIEALNKALTLDLKRLTFFCDDYMLYQYVSVPFISFLKKKLLALFWSIELLINRELHCLWEYLVVLIIFLLIK
jgi:hypothetical protein